MLAHKKGGTPAVRNWGLETVSILPEETAARSRAADLISQARTLVGSASPSFANARAAGIELI